MMNHDQLIDLMKFVSLRNRNVIFVPDVMGWVLGMPFIPTVLQYFLFIILRLNVQQIICIPI